MKTYDQILIDYIKIDDTAVKNIIIDLFVDSENNSLSNFIETILTKCGISSINTMVVQGNKWDVYMSFTDNNIFYEQTGVLELVDKPVTKQEADRILANKLIQLLDTVNFYDFKSRI